MPEIWTEDRVTELKRLWARGDSAREIGHVLACFAHTTDDGRNAVLGKVHRLGLSARAWRCNDPEVLQHRKERRAQKHIEGQRKRRNSTRTGLPVTRALPPADLPETAPYIGSLGLPFDSLKPQSSHDVNQCRFIEGESPDFLTCANTTAPGASWCPHHQKIVWTPAERRRRVVEGLRRGVKASNYTGSYEAA